MTTEGRLPGGRGTQPDRKTGDPAEEETPPFIVLFMFVICPMFVCASYKDERMRSAERMAALEGRGGIAAPGHPR